jgi:hypothetical protein
MKDIQAKLDSFVFSVTTRLDHVQSVFQSSLNTSTHRDDKMHQDEIDRRSNVIIFGVPEDREAATWRRSADDILQFVCNRSVDIVDIFRLGRFRPDKVRPILVKLRTVWDKRMLLSNCYKLKQYELRGIFIAPDEPLETRRKQTLDRLKNRAERENKQVAVIDNTLHIDGVAVYSLVNGSIGNTRNGRS